MRVGYARVSIHEQNLEYEKFKSIAYSTLIDIAEKELKIEIRKKYDAKQ